MKKQELGIITELPAVQEGEELNLLVLEDKANLKGGLLRTGLNHDNTLYWWGIQSKQQYNNDNFQQDFPNGAEAFLITFETEG